ncbi:MAG: DUF2127 domain-containing protein [Waterburya sp.]
MKRKRPIGLKIIVAYKAALFLLLTLTASILLLVSDNHSRLIAFSESYLLESKLSLIETFVEKILTQRPKTIQYSGIVAGIYALVTAVETIGLWYQKVWAEILVLILVGSSIPLEIYELLKSFTLLKLMVFIANVAIFLYLLRFVLQTVRSHKR